MTLAECLTSHQIDDYILEHIQIEKDCSQQDDLTLVWSDEISLTLCFLASLAHRGNYFQDHLLQRLFQWWMNGQRHPSILLFNLVKLKRVKLLKSKLIFRKILRYFFLRSNLFFSMKLLNSVMNKSVVIGSFSIFGKNSHFFGANRDVLFEYWMLISFCW